MEITEKTTEEPIESSFELIEKPQKSIQDELAAVEKQFEEYRENTERQIDSARDKGYQEGFRVRQSKPSVTRILLFIICFIFFPWYITKIICQLVELNTVTKLETILAMKDCAGSAPLFDDSL